MISFNARFVPFLRRRTEGRSRSPLPPDLAALADGGFVPMNGCFVLSAMAAKGGTDVTHMAASNPVGYECWFNSLHLDNYAPTGDEAVEIGAALARRVFAAWHRDHADKALRMLLSVSLGSDPRTATMKFHLERDGQRWLADDLDGYREEAVLTLRSHDAAFLDIFGEP